MSIALEDMNSVMDEYEKVRKYVIRILGKDLLNSNHYGQCLLFNKVINLNTPEFTIVDIWEKYVKLYEQIKKIFLENKMEIKNEHFKYDSMSGFLTFLNIYFDVDKSVKEIENAIVDFSNIKNRIDKIALKYECAESLDFRLSYNKTYEYHLFGNIISSKTSNTELEIFIKQFSIFNSKINNLAKLCRYNKRNILHNFTENKFFIFGKQVYINQSDMELIELIHKAQLFESRLKYVLKELNIIERYRIKYTNEVFVYFGKIGHRFNIEMSYENIKKEISETDEWYFFRKKDKKFIKTKKH